ncbi:unnamed protein product [Cuscuta campestris]|uniref:Uncharacterized protein n=1 Tax=Cuscuta campestris TaxID=132261 RepID=A0A484L9E1_9ASTE|nr:unnamed protein product [Cuscuta campestris]
MGKYLNVPLFTDLGSLRRVANARIKMWGRFSRTASRIKFGFITMCHSDLSLMSCFFVVQTMCCWFWAAVSLN